MVDVIVVPNLFIEMGPRSFAEQIFQSLFHYQGDSCLCVLFGSIMSDEGEKGSHP